MESETWPFHPLYSAILNFLLWYSTCISNHKHEFPCVEIWGSDLLDLSGNTRRSYISQLFLRSSRSNSPSYCLWLRLRGKCCGCLPHFMEPEYVIEKETVYVQMCEAFRKEKNLLLVF